MAYLRRVVLLGPGARTIKADLTARAGEGCWFELHRQGGCGAGELVLNDGFANRDAVEVGDWVAYEPNEAVRWYLGRVEERRAASPVVVRYRLAGMSSQLSEVFPGGFGREIADGIPPHLLARTEEWFAGDPDQSDQTFDRVSGVNDVLTRLMEGYVVPRTDIAYEPGRIEEVDGAVWSVKFRGEETAQSILKELALRAKDASFGVDESGTFFFLKKKTGTALTLREGRDVLSLAGVTDWELLVNRVLLTGDYVYEEESSAAEGRRFARWRGHYLQPASREQYGDRRLKMWVPWIRRREDAVTFLREFFRVYSQPGEKFLVEARVAGDLIRPWEGRVRIENRAGQELITAVVNSVRVEFDRVPLVRMELGPEDPRALWPEPAQDERYEIPRPEERRPGWGGDLITLTTSEGSSTSSDLSESSSGSSDRSSEGTSSERSSSSEGSSSSPSSSELTSDSESTSETPSSSGASSDATTSSGGSESSATSESVSSSDAGSSSEENSGETSAESSSEGTSDFVTSGDDGSEAESASSSWESSSETISGSSSQDSGSVETSSEEESSGDESSSAGSSDESGSSGGDSSSDGPSSEGSSDEGSSAGESSGSGESEGGEDSGGGSDGGGGGNSDESDSNSEPASSSQSSSSSELTSSEGESSSLNSSSGDSSAGSSDSSGGSSLGSETSGEGCLWEFVVGEEPEGGAFWQKVFTNCPGGTCPEPDRPGNFPGELVWTPCG